MTVGTLDYMPPEILNKDPYGPEVDIWSTGVLFYECIAGLPPFAAFNKDQQQQLDKTRDNIRRAVLNFNIGGKTVFSVV